MPVKTLCIAIALNALILAGVPVAAEDTFTNIMPYAGQEFKPGAVVLLPDGRRAVIEAYLPNGQLKTDIGVILTPQGVISEGAAKGETVTLIVPDKTEANAPVAPEARSNQPAFQESNATAPKVKQAAPETQLQKMAVPQSTPPAQRQEQYYTLAELLPMTKTPEQKATQENKQERPKAKKQQENIQEKQKQPKMEKAKPEKASSGKKPAPKSEKKARPGEELSIPPEAAKTGNLDFLEGCWQGTRPEYYSKRTIRECFCFGANGKNGKRRVFDPKGGRQCIGASRASLSRSGVLSVTSSGAACNDGERWGQAEMVCRNSGPKTPCSWVFRDASNGQQSYEIPFVRVESCGR